MNDDNEIIVSNELVPLTKEWHLKFGAKEVNEFMFDYCFRKTIFRLIFDKTKNEWWIEYHNEGIITPLPTLIKYVFEFKGFWRFVTGEYLNEA